MMRRRTFLKAAVIGIIAAPRAVAAQPAGKTYRIGLLLPATAPVGSDAAQIETAFSAGLRELGYVEQRNIVIEQRYAEGRLDRLPQLAAELVRLGVDVII